MYLAGIYRNSGVVNKIYIIHENPKLEILLVNGGDTVVSAYKRDEAGNEYCYDNTEAGEVGKSIIKALESKKIKKQVAAPFALGAMGVAEFAISKTKYTIGLFRKDIANIEIESGDLRVEATYTPNMINVPKLEYVKLTKQSADIKSGNADEVAVRTVEEIALTKKDITWLRNKKYYVVNDDEAADKIFTFLDNYNGPIAYDIETTGLRVNMFSKVNSKYEKALAEYNETHDEKIRADKLVGIIFCVQENVSYYFPCANRKFKNLFSDKDSAVRQRITRNIKARYTVGEFSTRKSDMADYIRNTSEEDFRLDVILMERVRKILETKHIVTHGGSFEWKGGWVYEIDTNIKDDTMIMHQLMYKFRTTTSNKGEPSNLKYLSKVELGIDQWELSDFFPGVDENEYGEVKTNTSAKSKGRKKSKSTVDFSYMDYEGTKIYAPADGDCTFLLFKKFKADMMKNHREIEYLYNVEVIVLCAIGYVEFFGHRINEDKIESVRESTRAEMSTLQSEIRQEVKYSSAREIDVYNRVVELMKQDIDGLSKEEVDEHVRELIEATKELNDIMENDNEHPFNISSPQQVSRLFYSPVEEGGLGYKLKDNSTSVAKGSIKPLVNEKGPDGKPKNIVAFKYSEYKKLETLMTKFFDNLQYFMYPGGFIFSHYGQIAAATGRMNCSKPNAQQYPKAITKIVEPRDGFAEADADYSQIEYRVLTALANNTDLAKLFSDPDSDYHTLMASLMYDVPYESVTPQMRGSAKSFNFGIPYGMGLASLAKLLHDGVANEETKADAAEKYEMYFKNQPNTRKFFDTVKESAAVNGYSLTYFKRRRDYSFADKDGNINGSKRAAALRQAGNAVIQGTAADIFKISLARVFTYVRTSGLIGKLLITNLIHDEQLFEIDARNCNVMRVLVDIGRAMQFHIDGFPPLFIGAGVGKSWGEAKGKMAEIHPYLLEKFTQEYGDEPIFREYDENINALEITKHINELNYEFRRDRIKAYLIDENNWHKDIHPAIGSLINLQFNFGRGGSAKEYVGKNGEKYTDEQFLMLNVADFIKEFIKPEESNVTVDCFRTTLVDSNEEEDKEYEDDEDAFDEDTEFIEDTSEFQLINESKLYGADIRDLINSFGVCVLRSKRICGINMKGIYYKKKEAIVNYLADRYTEDEANGFRVCFLLDGNVLKNLDVYVSNVNQTELDILYNKKYK